jgi:hypothetical protein
MIRKEKEERTKEQRGRKKWNKRRLNKLKFNRMDKGDKEQFFKIKYIYIVQISSLLWTGVGFQ